MFYNDKVNIENFLLYKISENTGKRDLLKDFQTLEISSFLNINIGIFI